MRILLSACLLGVYCRYNGKAETNDELLRALREHELIPFCPEIHGGLPTPREPSEILGDRVLTVSGRDVTEEYRRGADEAVRLAKLLACDCAVMQDRSPSCGKGIIHNGLFDGGLAAGDGMAVRALLAAGIPVYSASEAPEKFAAHARGKGSIGGCGDKAPGHGQPDSPENC